MPAHAARRLANENGSELSEDELTAAFELIATGSSGQITLNEWCAWWTSKSKQAAPPPAA